MNNFFRKDLTLQKKWWHRLLKVGFIFLIITIVFLGIREIVNNEDRSLPRYHEAGLLYERMSNEPKQLSSLISGKEKIANIENGVYQNYEGNGGYLVGREDIYCSKNITNHISKISSKLGTTRYKGNGSEEVLTKEEFKQYLENNNANCVWTTHLTNFKGIVDEKKVLGRAFFVGEDMKVWKPSILNSILYILTKLLRFLLFLAFIVFIYYRVFIYIIYGSSKKK